MLPVGEGYSQSGDFMLLGPKKRLENSNAWLSNCSGGACTSLFYCCAAWNRFVNEFIQLVDLAVDSRCGCAPYYHSDIGGFYFDNMKDMEADAPAHRFI
jgi:hypothetical protein